MNIPSAKPKSHLAKPKRGLGTNRPFPRGGHRIGGDDTQSKINVFSGNRITHGLLEGKGHDFDCVSPSRLAKPEKGQVMVEKLTGEGNEQNYC